MQWKFNLTQKLSITLDDTKAITCVVQYSKMKQPVHSLSVLKISPTHAIANCSINTLNRERWKTTEYVLMAELEPVARVEWLDTEEPGTGGEPSRALPNSQESFNRDVTLKLFLQSSYLIYLLASYLSYPMMSEWLEKWPSLPISWYAFFF